MPKSPAHPSCSYLPTSIFCQLQPHGRTWKILDKVGLMSTAVPKYFVHKKFESFTRQLSGWGFKRLHQSGADYGCYYHECFLCGLPLLTRLMTRVKSNQGKPTPFPEGEPDFFFISQLFPLSSTNQGRSSDFQGKNEELEGDFDRDMTAFIDNF